MKEDTEYASVSSAAQLITHSASALPSALCCTQLKTVTKNVFMTTFLTDSTAKTVEKRRLAGAQLRNFGVFRDKHVLRIWNQFAENSFTV